MLELICKGMKVPQLRRIGALSLRLIQVLIYKYM